MAKVKRPARVSALLYTCKFCNRKKHTTTLTRASREELCSNCKRHIRNPEAAANAKPVVAL